MHGGNVYSNQIDYDFSINLNPYGPYPEIVNAVNIAAKNLTVYPEYNSHNLTDTIASYFGLPSEYVGVTNGASEAISALIGNQYFSNVILDIPSFYGYERALNPEQQLHTYSRRSLLKLNENLIPKNSIVVTANPTNPTGEYTDSFKIESLYKRIREAGSVLVIDESFLPISDYFDESFIYKIKENERYYDHLVVVRSFTKSFSIPAIRLGYFVSSNERLVSLIMNSLPEWNVSVFAQVAGNECMKIIYKLKNDYAKIRAERIRLEKALTAFGFYVYESCTNYILFLAPAELYNSLLNQRILIRDCSDYRGIDAIADELLCKNISKTDLYSINQNDGIFRIAVKTPAENDTLLREISKIMSSPNFQK